MFPDLLPEQQELLIAMVEAARSVSRQDRHPFMLLRTMQGDSLLHDGFPFHYWRALSDLVQRQEHGSTRDKEDLRWEDARRLIYQTANAMYEIDRSLACPR